MIILLNPGYERSGQSPFHFGDHQRHTRSQPDVSSSIAGVPGSRFSPSLAAVGLPDLGRHLAELCLDNALRLGFDLVPLLSATLPDRYWSIASSCSSVMFFGSQSNLTLSGVAEHARLLAKQLGCSVEGGKLVKLFGLDRVVHQFTEDELSIERDTSNSDFSHGFLKFGYAISDCGVLEQSGTAGVGGSLCVPDLRVCFRRSNSARN